MSELLDDYQPTHILNADEEDKKLKPKHPYSLSNPR